MMEIKTRRFAAVAVSTTAGKSSSPPSVTGQSRHPNLDIETVNKILASRLEHKRFIGKWHVTL